MGTTDRELLSVLAKTQSREAFAEIVERHLGLVYAAARRQVGSAIAEDLTQSVFLLLWEKPGRIRDGAHLAGWLIDATRLQAMQWHREEGRRQRRETVAAQNRNHLTGDVVNSSNPELSPLLDRALGALNESERSAIVLRYLKDQSLEEVATAAGVSSNTAAKRISRGLGRLRRALRAQGATVSAEAIESALIAIARQSPVPPAHLVGQTINHAISAHGIIATVAKGASLRLFLTKLSTIAATVLLATTLIVGAWYATRLSAAPSVAADVTSSSVRAGPDQPALAGPIDVGITVSKLTAITKSPSGKPWGYGVQARIVKDLTAPGIQLYPVIEPGTLDDPALRAQLAKVFPNAAPVDGGDPDALSHLDVLVAHEDWMVPPPMLKAVDKAVSGGLNLLNIGGMGWANPGLHGSDPSPLRLTGMVEGQGGYTKGLVECDVIKNDDLLGQLAPSGKILLDPLGMYGILPPDATPLMRVADMTAVIPRGPRADDGTKFVCYPVYMSHLEKGRIVGIAIAPYSMPDARERTKLLLRSVRWLAGSR